MQVKTIVIFVLVTILSLVGVTMLLWNFGTQTAKPIPEVKGEMRHVLGEGKIVITEWSDLQCPACAGVQEPLKELLNKYEGKVKLVYRHLPLPSIHKNAIEAAVAAEAAAEQGKFWEMHDLLFARQSEWEELAEPKDKFGDYAEELGMERARFESDLEKDELRQRVLKDSAEAVRYRIQATPTFFVEGERVEFAGLAGKIESMLAE